ncbi:hypothetical protein SAMN05660649_04647 [Desulfotomaculum arcticum]|uniref:Uncharacterized protein n=1 Tax=Desulfotruncus arcticus DSM 17038 TaxID=1121424 RepID=A0A1I2YWL0_9FIRM|nr:hypothetical protein [Desulfotruncus arcticus]SFH29860.1 hypothetical protein SAMN05660649_04647 [Desulfotomaculum arcticum] [Desulfotruncus arcticus DSM 17038]
MYDNSRDMLFNKIINSLTVISGCAQLASRVDYPEKVIHYFNEIISQMDKLLFLLIELYKLDSGSAEPKYSPMNQYKSTGNRPPLIVL